MTSALAMHDHLLRLLLHQHCGYEVNHHTVDTCAYVTLTPTLSIARPLTNILWLILQLA